MRSIAAIALTLLIQTGLFAALTPSSSIDDVLDALHEVGKDLKSFSANVTLRETDMISQDSSKRTGMTVYQQTPDGNSMLRVTFLKRVQDNLAQDQRIEYLLDGGWLIERNYPRKLEVRRQVSRPGEKTNLLRLGEGPFPLPIGQSKEEVKKQFDVTRPEGVKPLEGTAVIRLTPRKDTRFERSFAKIDVWVDLNTGMPRRIDTVDTNETLMRGTDFDDVRLNAPLTAEHFALPPIGKDWQRRDETFTE